MNDKKVRTWLETKPSGFEFKSKNVAGALDLTPHEAAVFLGDISKTDKKISANRRKNGSIIGWRVL